jgi:hypothetical protein
MCIAMLQSLAKAGFDSESWEDSGVSFTYGDE